jgi:repressor LexA
MSRRMENCMRRGLTPRQCEVLVAVRELAKGERGPSLRQLGDAVGLASTWAVRRHLDILERHGLISREPKKFRGIRVVRSSESVSGVAA